MITSLTLDGDTNFCIDSFTLSPPPFPPSSYRLVRWLHSEVGLCHQQHPISVCTNMVVVSIPQNVVLIEHGGER